MQPFSPEILNSPKVVVYCWATWCPPCKKYPKVLEKVEKRLNREGITFLSLDCTKAPSKEIHSLLRDDTWVGIALIVMPSLFFFRNGKLLQFNRPDGVVRTCISGLHTGVVELTRTIKNIFEKGVEYQCPK